MSAKKFHHPCVYAAGNGAKPFTCEASKGAMCTCQRWCTLKREYEATSCGSCQKFTARK